MREKPIFFNTDMVWAIMDGRKTVTRRVIKKSQCNGLNKIGPADWERTCLQEPWRSMTDAEFIKSAYRPPYQQGDILYVRETWQYIDFAGEENGYVYKASKNGNDWEENSEGWTWQPSIHMPKAAARIWLKVTDVRVEQLQDITEEQAKAEGAIDNRGFIHSPENEYSNIHTAKEHFMQIWNSTIKKSEKDRYGWDADPWVWVIAFERYEEPVKTTLLSSKLCVCPDLGERERDPLPLRSGNGNGV